MASSQHENFERNAANFKEIDEYVNGVLNFERFLGTIQLDSEFFYVMTNLNCIFQEQNDLKVIKTEENSQKVVKKSPEKPKK